MSTRTSASTRRSDGRLRLRKERAKQDAASQPKVTSYFGVTKSRSPPEQAPDVKRMRQGAFVTSGDDEDCKKAILASPTQCLAATNKVGRYTPSACAPEVDDDENQLNVSPPRRRKTRTAVAGDGVSVHTRCMCTSQPSTAHRPADATVAALSCLLPTTLPGSAKRRLLFTLAEREENSLTTPGRSTVTSRLTAISTVPNASATASSQATPAKASLGRVRNLAQLQSRLCAFSDVANRLAASAADVGRRDDDEYRAHISPTKVAKTTSKATVSDDSDEELRPAAYARYAHLLTPTSPSKASLTLPDAHANLSNTFRSLDMVVAMLHQRDQRITFDGVRQSVQTVTKHDFTHKHLMQIKHVYPESYECKWEQPRTQYGRRVAADTEWDLVLRPNLETDLISLCHKPAVAMPSPHRPLTPPFVQTTIAPSAFSHRLHASPVKSRPFLASPAKMAHKPNAACGSAEKADTRTRLTGARQMYRLSIFNQRLLDDVKRAHQAFLRKLTPSVELTDAEHDQLHRWHPAFELNSVPPVPAADIAPATTKGDVPKTATALLRSIRDLREANLPQNVRTAIAQAHTAANTNAAAAATVSGHVAEVSSTSVPLEPVVATPVVNCNGVRQALLDKIRAKQTALQTAAALTRTSSTEARLACLMRLPDFVRILRMYYTAECISSLPQETVVKKLAQSYGALIGHGDVQQGIDALLEVCARTPPAWMERATQHGIVYYRVRRTLSAQPLLDAIEQERRTLDVAGTTATKL